MLVVGGALFYKVHPVDLPLSSACSANTTTVFEYSPRFGTVESSNESAIWANVSKLSYQYYSIVGVCVCFFTAHVVQLTEYYVLGVKEQKTIDARLLATFLRPNVPSIVVDHVDMCSTAPSSLAKKSTRKKSINTLSNYKDELLQSTPYLIVAQRKGSIKFPLRKRGNICFLCGKNEEGDELKKCSEGKCKVVYHASCVESLPSYGYDKGFLFRKGPNKLTCPLHHCTGCFNNLFRVRCFNGSLVKCSQCELAWHADCIPAGCERSARGEIVCPRHRSFPAEPQCHTSHCADCQKKDDRSLVRCTRCLRSYHFDCMKEVDHTMGEDTEAYRSNAVCIWCMTSDFVAVGQHCMARQPSRSWYPCTIVDNKEYPQQNDPNLGKLGFVTVRWLSWRNRIYHSLLPYNRIIPMSERDYFFIVEADEYECYEEWKELQEQVKKTSYIPPKPGLVADGTSNGRKYRIAKVNQYTSAESKIRPKKPDVDVCNCPKNAKNRCGPGSGCLNRQIFVECPKECETIGGGCNNRMVARGEEKKVEKFLTPGGMRGYGLKAKQRFVKEEFVGEYIGEVITKAESDKRVAELERYGVEAQYYIMDYDNGKRFLDAQFVGSNMRFANHSCDPNCTISIVWSGDDLHLMLEAIKDIEIDDEITFDYNMVRASSRGKGLSHCRCGALNCSGVMSVKGDTPPASVEPAKVLKPKNTPTTSKPHVTGTKKRMLSLEPTLSQQSKRRKTIV
ncbi:histone-lysine N-methyltransferaseH3 lysine-36 and H4 lysine-20 specific-like protein [Aphelenchoides avenae]|nr:histone-lysine N-methyltransferaseH3 lysine-36 and H4 lysine-20 specific-like protein [Aphelenchus avenae]